MSPIRSAFLRGFAHALPFLLVIPAFGALYGVLATDAGLSLFETVAFSLAVFAGASQFAALQLMQDQAPVLIILIAALAVNLRMMMYSVALAPHLGAAPVGLRAVVAYFLVDQSFALSLAEYDKRPLMGLAEKLAYFFGTVLPLTAMWNGSVVVGAVMGRAIPQDAGLDFALPITFMALVAPSITTRAHVAAVAVAMLGSLALWFLPYGTGVVVAGACGMAAGALVEFWGERTAA